MINQAQKSIYKNSLIIMVARIASMIASFLIVPFIITSLGLNGYGVWESLMAIAAFSTLVLTSISQTMVWRISLAYGANDLEEVKDWFHHGIFLTLVQVVTIVPLFYFFRWEIISWFDIPEEFRGQVAELLPIVCGIMLLGGIAESAGAVLSGYQKSGFVILYKSVTTIFGQVVSIAFLLAGFGLASIAIGFIFNNLLVFIILNWHTRRLIHRLSFYPKVITLAKVNLTRSFFLLTLVGAVTLLFRNQISKLILAAMDTSETVANYGIASRISSLVYLTVTFIMTPTITAVSAAFAENDEKTISSIFTESLSSFAFLNNLITLLLCVLSERLIVVWIGFCTDEINLFTQILLIGQSIAVLTTAIGVSVCTGLGKREIETHYIILNLILNVIVLLILVKIMGPIGAVIASSATWAISGFYFLYIMYKKVNLPKLATKKSLLSLFITLILIALFRIILMTFPISNNRWQSFYESAIISLIIIPIYFLVNKKFNLMPELIILLKERIMKKQKRN
jgi:O-antigen/teichoic acid export membrane protein